MNKMARFLLCVLANVMLCVVTIAKSLNSYPFPFVPRSQWGAQPAKSENPLNSSVPYVVIHHSYEPGVCLSKEACIGAMKSMQKYHQEYQRWSDIGYNFAVGGEGSVYEGRGWENVGAHAVRFNAKSIGICIIGDWVHHLPPARALETTKELIATGVKLGYISPDYILIGHRQASQTECPGSALFNEISNWDHFKQD